MTRLELLERVNRLNIVANGACTFWTCTVLYNTVIWCGDKGTIIIFETIKGIPE